MGPELEHAKEIRILNRIVSGNGCKGLIYEVDPRHAEIVVEQLGFQEAKTVSSPGTKDEGRTQDDCNEILEEDEASKYRALVARCN